MLKTASAIGLTQISNEYCSLLQEYLVTDKEEPLHQIYELGRSVLNQETGILILCSIHHDALAAILEKEKNEVGKRRLILKAGNFLMQCLASFEMTHQGFCEANASLIQANQDLLQKTADLMKANSDLDQVAAMRKKAEESLRNEVGFLELLQKIAAAANEAADINALMKIVLEQICYYAGWPAGCAITKFCFFSVWYFKGDPQVSFKKFIESLESRTKLLSSDFNQLARRAFWVQDLSADPVFAEFKKIDPVDMQVTFIFPVVVDKEVIAVLNFFARDRSDFDFRLLEIMGLIGDQIGKALIRINRFQEKHGQLKASLKEKEILLQEIHHRVKNNLQIICSLMNLQTEYVKNREVAEIFKKCQNQIKAIALLHETLYQSKNLAQIDFSEYAHHLCENLFACYGIDTDQICLKIDIKNFILGVDSALPCGLIINELVSNALKHAFKKREQGEIQVGFSLESGKKFVLMVKDNGIGLPENFNLRNKGSLGFELVSTLTDQLKGVAELLSKNGTTVRITFPARFIEGGDHHE